MEGLALQNIFERFFERMGDLDTFFMWGFYAVIVMWLIYSVILLYHWLRYNLHAFFTFPSVVIYVVVSFAIIGYASGGLL